MANELLTGKVCLARELVVYFLKTAQGTVREMVRGGYDENLHPKGKAELLSGQFLKPWQQRVCAHVSGRLVFIMH